MNNLIRALLISAVLPATAMADDIVTTAQCRTDSSAVATVQSFGWSGTGTAFVDVPGLIVTIDNKGAVADCVEVDYQASSRSQGSDIISRPLMDGHIVAAPAAIRTSGVGHTYFETGGGIFIFRGVTKGQHTIKMQVRSTSPSGGWTLLNRSIAVRYKGQ